MKKAIIIIAVLAIVAFIWSQLGKAKLSLSMLEGRTAIVGRGDLTIPISGTGEIQPKSRSEIKPEASGEVVEVPVKPGQMVRKGEIIIKLDPQDEERSVRRQRNEVERAQALLEQSRLRLQERKTSSLAQIDARIESVNTQLKDAEYRLNKIKDLRARELETEDIMVQVQCRYDQLLAQREGFLADRNQAMIAIELAARDVILGEKTLETARTNLSDAEKRLRETNILAPNDGMISMLKVEVGEVVQGGRTTITGGTVLAVVADVSDLYVRTEVSDADIGAVLWLAPANARPGGAQLSTELAADDVPLMVSTAGIVDRVTPVGTPVEIRVDSFRDEEFEGVIEQIYPEPKKIQNIVTYLVDIRVTSPNRRKLALVLGMQADVEFTAESVTDAILVPHDAIRRGPTDGLGVYVREQVEGEAGVRPRFVACRFGLDNGLFAELLEGEGIEEGTEVYTKLPSRFGTDEEDEE